MVKVSVIIPVYNVAPYLGECLDSVLSQSLKDIEIICIDDCSTDGSLSLLEKYAEGDSRIRVLSNDRNRDVSVTRNRGIKESCGEYIFFVDSDDVLYDNNVLETFYHIAIKDLSDAVWGRSVNWYWEAQDLCYEIDTSVNSEKDIRKGTVSKFPILACNVTVWNKLLLRSFILKNRLFFDETLRKFEDNDFSCRVAVHARTISYVAINTYKYRQRKENDKSKMYMKGREDALWKCHAAKNMVSAVRTAKPVVQKIYAKNIGDMLRGAYRDFIRYGKGDEFFKDFMIALSGVFTDMPEGISMNLPMELQLASIPLGQGRYADAWAMLYMYKKMRVLYYVRYLILVADYQLKQLIQ